MITVVPDTVGGTPCLIFYQDERPILTLWEHDIGNSGIAQTLMWLGCWHDTGELKELMTLIVEMGGDFQQVQAAVQTYLGEKLNQTGGVVAANQHSGPTEGSPSGSSGGRSDG